MQKKKQLDMKIDMRRSFDSHITKWLTTRQ